MSSDIKSSYGVGFRFAVAFPLTFLIPPVAEFIQHVIEWRIGMFDSLQQADALANHPARLGFGYIKSAALLIVGLWASRYVHSGGERRATRAVGVGVMAAFVPVIVLSLALDYGQRALGPWTSAEALGQAGSIAAGLGLFLLGSVLIILLAGWRVGVPLRDRRMNLFTSIWRGLTVLPKSLALYFAAFLPLLVLHTALNVAMAFAGPGTTLWILFAVDSLLVGFIATVLWSVFHAIYRRGLARAKLAPVAL